MAIRQRERASARMASWESVNIISGWVVSARQDTPGRSCRLWRDRDASRTRCMPVHHSLRDIVHANPERSFMHLVITLAVAIGTALLIGCAEPLAPDSADHAPS